MQYLVLQAALLVLIVRAVYVIWNRLRVESYRKEIVREVILIAICLMLGTIAHLRYTPVFLFIAILLAFRSNSVFQSKLNTKTDSRIIFGYLVSVIGYLVALVGFIQGNIQTVLLDRALILMCCALQTPALRQSLKGIISTDRTDITDNGINNNVLSAFDAVFSITILFSFVMHIFMR